MRQFIGLTMCAAAGNLIVAAFDYKWEGVLVVIGIALWRLGEEMCRPENKR